MVDVLGNGLVFVFDFVVVLVEFWVWIYFDDIFVYIYEDWFIEDECLVVGDYWVVFWVVVG